MRTSVFSCLLLLGCGGASAPGGQASERALPPRPETISAPDPRPAPFGCQLETSTTLERRGGVYEVVAWLRNPTNQTLEVDMPDRCPRGVAVFHGLPDGYDYYRSCTKGACMGGRPPIHRSIPAGQSIDVEAIEIDPVNANCNRPLEPGSYRLTFAFETSFALCIGPTATFEHALPPVSPPGTR